MLSILRGYLARYLIPIAVAGGLVGGVVLTRWFYAPIVAAANEQIADLTTSVKLQNDAVKRWKDEATAAQKKARAAIAAEQAKQAATERELAAARAALANREHRNESCESAADWVREQWRAR